MFDYKVKEEVEKSIVCLLDCFNILTNKETVGVIGVANGNENVSLYIKLSNNDIIDMSVSIRKELKEEDSLDSPTLVFDTKKIPMSIFSSSLERIIHSTKYDDLGCMCFSDRTTLQSFIIKYITKWLSKSESRKKEFLYRLASNDVASNGVNSRLKRESLFK